MLCPLQVFCCISFLSFRKLRTFLMSSVFLLLPPCSSCFSCSSSSSFSSSLTLLRLLVIVTSKGTKKVNIRHFGKENGHSRSPVQSCNKYYEILNVHDNFKAPLVHNLLILRLFNYVRSLGKSRIFIPQKYFWNIVETLLPAQAADLHS